MESKSLHIHLIGMNREKSDILRTILNYPDYDLSVTNSEVQLLNSGEHINADCLIIDFDVWRGSSFDLKNSALRKNNPAIPVIFTGDQSDDGLIAESFDKGADDYIPYPFRKSEVLARISNQFFLSRTKRSLEEEVEKRTSDLLQSNTLLNESNEEYRSILKELQENETLLLTIALNIPNSYLAIIETNYTIGFASGQEFKKNNIDPWRLIGLPVEKVFKEQAGYVKNIFKKTFEGEETVFELKLNNQDLLYKAVPLFNSDGAVPRILVVAENITEQKLSERSIKDSLREKETLLKEIHHRVKNNMQLVCSMINLQAESIDNREVFDIFRVLQSRIFSMSLVHEKLYHHKQFSKINFREYVTELVSEIRNSFSRDNGGNHINIELQMQDENFTVDKAIPCGLILNELILNAFKHASLASNEGLIKIVFLKTEQGCYRLSVSDNGKGLPEGFDIIRTESMGMMLVRELVNQLKGSISVESGSETTFTIVFGETPCSVNRDYSAGGNNGNKNILLVEDERIISRMLRRILEEKGYNIVDAVTSGRGAIDSAAKFNPDLIIMDIMLEDEIDGVEAAAVILKNHGCPIVFLTGNSDPATLKSARDINPYEMLTKPVEKYQLIDVIESALK